MKDKLISPHGGKLVNRLARQSLEDSYLGSLPRVDLDKDTEMDVEQLGIGTFSPLEGFMNSLELKSVLMDMQYTDGSVWSLPIVLSVSKEKAKSLIPGNVVVLMDTHDSPLALLHLEEIYPLDKKFFIKNMYGKYDENHPGIKFVERMESVLLGGKITLLNRRQSAFRDYEFSPEQIRKDFNQRGWNTVIGFHSRNVIHRSHEFIQMKALKDYSCDGLFIQPVVGSKKKGDFKAEQIIKSYEIMLERFYPRGRVTFSTFSTYSRYAGPREALFTAICRKNFGCSHFIVGRDHTGVLDYYPPTASQEIFDSFPELGMEIIKYDNVCYSASAKQYLDESSFTEANKNDKLHISGTQARDFLKEGKVPPDWFMRPEISGEIINSIKNGEEVFEK